MQEIRYLSDARYPGPRAHRLPAHIKGTPTQAELDAEARMFTWCELKDIIRSGRLEKLMRNKGQQRAYDVWMRGMKREYGTTEKYLKQARLPWTYDESDDIHTAAPDQNDRPEPIGRGASSSQTSGMSTPSSAGFVSLDDVKLHHKLLKSGTPANGDGAATGMGEGSEPSFLRYDPEKGLDTDTYAVLPNDWPYCVPYGVRHYCVWSKVPIAHPSLVEYDPHKWSIIQEEGLGGFTGVIPILDLSSTSPSTSSAFSSASLPSPQYKTSQCTRSIPPPPPPALHITPHVPSDTQSDIPANEAYAIDCQHGGDEMRRWAGVGYEAEGGGEVGGMVRALWDERGWECLWFVNPPRLQSVPGLSHFHVFARRKTPGEISATEDAVRDGALKLMNTIPCTANGDS